MSDIVERLRALDSDAGEVIEAAVDQNHRDALLEAAAEITRLRAHFPKEPANEVRLNLWTPEERAERLIQSWPTESATGGGDS